MGIRLAEVLDDTVGKHAIETVRFEGKESRVGTNEIRCESELRPNRTRGENEPNVRIDRSNLVTLAAGGRSPAPEPQPTSSKRSSPSACGKRISGIGYSRSFRIRCEYMYPLVASTVICTAGWTGSPGLGRHSALGSSPRRMRSYVKSCFVFRTSRINSTGMPSTIG